MNWNNLIVHVMRAEGLRLQHHKTIDAYVSLAVSGQGSKTKSKVSTNQVKTDDGDVMWDEHCEFNLLETDTTLVVHVNYKNSVGITENLGQLQFDLTLLPKRTLLQWHKLYKRQGENKDRGQLMLGFEFSNKVDNKDSISMMSFNTYEKTNRLDKLKQKLRLAKKKDADTLSIASFSSNVSNISSIVTGPLTSDPTPPHEPYDDQKSTYSHTSMSTDPILHVDSKPLPRIHVEEPYVPEPRPRKVESNKLLHKQDTLTSEKSEDMIFFGTKNQSLGLTKSGTDESKEMKQKNESLEKKNMELERRLEELEKRLASKDEELASKDAKFHRMEQQLNKKLELMRNALDQNDEMEGKDRIIQELEAKNHALENENARLQEHLQQAQEEFDQKASEMDIVKEELSKNQEITNSKIALLQKELDQKIHELDVKNHAINELEAKNTLLEETSQDLCPNCTSLQQVLDQKIFEIQLKERSIKDLEEKHVNLLSEIRKIEERSYTNLAKIQEKLDKKVIELDEKDILIKELEENVEAIQNEHELCEKINQEANHFNTSSNNQTRLKMVSLEDPISDYRINNGQESTFDTIANLRREVRNKEEHIESLENYLDELLARVIVSKPDLLQARPKQRRYY